jgi:flagellar protein FlgJ
MKTTEFFAKLIPDVLKVRQEGSKIFPSVRLAQNLLETGGEIHHWYNLGGIKVGRGKPNKYWDGQAVRKGTWEVYSGTTVDCSANFRAYTSLYNFYKDQDLLFNFDRYKRVREAKTPLDQATALVKCGYATDPAYADKIIKIIGKYHLEQYDGQKAKVATKPKPVKYKVITGDTLSEIATKHKTTVQAIMKLNPSIRDASKIRAGQTIVVG